MTDTDTHTQVAQVASLLAARGFSSRVVSNQEMYSVEVSLEGDVSALWTLAEVGWAYVVLDTANGGYQIRTQGLTELGDGAEPERVAWVVANFPYESEMDEEEVRSAVAELLLQVETMSDEEREAILGQVMDSGEDSETFSWPALQETGLLWSINRCLLHPSGLSMVLRYENGEPVGWAIIGDAGDPVQMDRLADIDGAQRFASFMETIVEAITE